MYTQEWQSFGNELDKKWGSCKNRDDMSKVKLHKIGHE